MRTLDLDDSSRVIVLGEGQVGSAISRSLTRSMPSVGHQTKTDWSTPAAAARSTTDALAGLPRLGPTTGSSTTVIWSAGTAGMTTTKERCDQNLETMKQVLRAALDSVPEGQRRALHLVSSAGAHANGAPRWPESASAATGDRPSRVPYIELKVAEERWARSLVDDPNPVDITVHRVASVYARPGDPGRSGMVAAMVRNAARGKVTPIFGRWSTIRNYVHADDVGDFVARSVHLVPDDGQRVSESLLVDRRSYAIGELVNLVSKAIRRPVPLQMIPADNAENHTFNPAMISAGFTARPLPTAIRQMFLELQP